MGWLTIELKDRLSRTLCVWVFHDGDDADDFDANHTDDDGDD